MRKDRRWIGCGIITLLLAGCTAEKPMEDPLAPNLSDPALRGAVILTVETGTYSFADFERWVSLAADESFSTLGSETLSRFFDSFVEEKLLLIEARRREIALTPEEKKAFIARLNRQMGADAPALAADEPASNLLLEKLLIEKLTIGLTRDVTVTPEEIQNYYSENKREFLRPEMVRVSQILLETEDKAVELYERLQGADEETFRKSASQKSRGAEAAKGGEMGIFELGQLPLDMERVIFALQPGEVSRVFESSYGYHIFRLDEKLTADLVDEAAASSRIEMKLLDRKIAELISEFVEDLKSRLAWTSFPEKMPFPYKRNEHE